MIMNAPTSSKRPSIAYHSADLFEVGIGYVAICRFKATGDAEAGVFLLDVFCLGAKNAFFSKIGADEFEGFLSNLFPRAPVELSAGCGRKLVEDAVAFAGRFDLAPHADYKQACRVFGGINAKECDMVFEFGKDGKPLYVSGPNDSPAQIDRIMSKLAKHAGTGKFDFLIEAPGGEFDGTK